MTAPGPDDAETRTADRAAQTPGTGGHEDTADALEDVSLDAELRALVEVHRRASGPGMRLLSLLGDQAGSLLDRIPGPVKGQLEANASRALELSYSGAKATRNSRLPDPADWLTTAMTSAMGAAGGMGGLPSAMAEIPVTTTVLMRAMQGIAAEHGFDPAEQDTRLDCLQVFAAAGPLTGDEGGEAGFLTLRLALSGPGMKALVARVAPIFAMTMGRKLAAQAVPVLGAVAGAAVNWVYTSYYQDMARVHFGLKAIARDRGMDHAALVGTFREMLADAPVAR